MHSNDHNYSAPVFHSIPKNQVVKEGASVIFTCTVHSPLNCWYVWDRNGLVKVPSHRIIITESSSMKSLQIKNVSCADSGLYRITVENEHGRIEATVRLIVVVDSYASSALPNVNHVPLRIKRQFMIHSTEQNMKVFAGLYQSTSQASLMVYSNEKILDENDQSQMTVHNNSVIIIKEHNTTDVMNYCCILQTKSGKIAGMVAKGCKTRHFNMLPPKIINHLPPKVTSVEGNETELIVEFDCSMAFTYVWLRNDVVIEDCHEFRYTDYGHGVLSLRIMDPFLLDSGVYKCIIFSPAGSCKTECCVKFEESDSECKSSPQIMLYPQSYVAELGSAVIICAHVTPPNSLLEWKICGKTVEENTKDLKMQANADGLHFLFINKVDYKHCGEIQCLAPIQNNIMATRASTMLTVIPCTSKDELQPALAKEEPYFLNLMENLRVFTGTKLRLEVRFHGYPEPQVIWMRAGRPIEDINASIITKPGHSILTIDGINANQSGKYAAFIINNYGSDTMSASVSVEGPPDPPSGRPSIKLDSNGMIVTWCGPPYDGGCVISGYLLEIQCLDNEWSVLAIVFDSLSYLIKQLVPNKSYSIRIRAKNMYGYSEPSLSSDPVIFPSLESYNEKVDSCSNYEANRGEEFSLLYESLEELGRGRFGVVYKVRQRETSDIRAAKMVKCIKSADKKKVQEEIAIMRSLQHPKLLQLVQCFEATRETIMVVEYISGGELFERVVADDFTLTEKDCVMFMRQICEGVNYMHNLLVVHLDLKPENIMCSTRNSHQIKIIDFGLAQQLSHNTSVRVLLGTPEFVPPEIINYEPIGLQSDMWSIGVICYVLLSGLSPFMGESDVDTFNNITRAEYDFDDDAFNAVSEEAKDFISGLLLYRKEERLSAAECLETKWLSLDSATLANSKICTNKLKKFIVRRKWQKTGNAIRALGRMASLSASRRNSSAMSNSGLKSNSWNQEHTTRNKIFESPKNNL